MKDRRADLIGTVRQKFQIHNGAQSRFQGFRGWVGGEDTETVNAALPSVTTVGTEVEKVWCWYKISTMFWKETEFEKWERLSSLSSRGLFLFLLHFSSLQHWVSVLGTESKMATVILTPPWTWSLRQFSTTHWRQPTEMRWVTAASMFKTQWFANIE